MSSCHDNIKTSEDPWYHWKTMAGYVYIAICLFDFLIMPIAVHANKVDTKEEILYIIEEHGMDEAIKIIDRMKGSAQWIPVTMIAGGMFHIAFGAILTGAAVTRGFERQEMAKNGRTEK